MRGAARLVAATTGGALGCVMAVAACGGGSTGTAGGPNAPLGPGYDDLRVLSRDDCMALRDHQIEIAVDDALAASDAGSTTDAGQRLALEADLRLKDKPATDAWIQRCTGRVLAAADLRCMREATTTRAFNACGTISDDAGSEGGGEVASSTATSASSNASDAPQ